MKIKMKKLNNTFQVLTTYCRKIGCYVYFHKQEIKSLNGTVHHILKNEVDLILPQFTPRKEKRGIFTSLITGFIGLTYEGISSFLHNRRHKALHKAVKRKEIKQIYSKINLCI